MERVIPNFFVIGVVKGGTTSLHYYLNQHPEIYLPPIKETNHFSQKDICEKDFLKEYALDVQINLDEYIASGMKTNVHIAHVNSPKHYKALFDPATSEKAVGEISNSYMICQGAARSIFEFNPESKIIVMLRNPISRAWSQFLMNIREAKNTSRNFTDELKFDQSREKKGWGVSHQYLELGNYATQLYRYFQLFKRENIKVIFYENFKVNQENILKEICDFLEVDNSFTFNLTRDRNIASRPRISLLNKILVKSGAIKILKDILPKEWREKMAQILYTRKNLPKISDEEREYLVDYYRNEVLQLSQMISEDPKGYWPEFKN